MVAALVRFLATILLVPGGLLVILRLVWRALRRFVRNLADFFCALLRLLGFCKKRGRVERDACCVDPPPQMRARPDPFIYSQFWLMARGLAVTWDNPDFTIIDPATGLAVDNHSLKPNTSYTVQALIHDGSTMAALSTSVHFEVLSFGAGTQVIDDLGTVSLDVPAVGSAIAEVQWTTPATAGHNCLRATIFHPDDANPQNNVGQHNTDVADPASPTRRTSFLVGNRGAQRGTPRFELDSYRLPSEPLRVRDFAERQSLRYLRRLQAANDRAKYPVAEGLNPRIRAAGGDGEFEVGAVLELASGVETEFVLDLDAPSQSSGRQSINVNVFFEEELVGGITAYAEPEP